MSLNSRSLDHNRILDLWAQGRTAREIAEIVKHPRWQSISNVVCDARKAGDPRAVARSDRTVASYRKVQTATSPTERRGARADGIEAISVRVVNRAALGFTASNHVFVSLPRLRFMDDEIRDGGARP